MQAQAKQSGSSYTGHINYHRWYQIYPVNKLLTIETIEKFINTLIGGIVIYQAFNTFYPNEVRSTTFFGQKALPELKGNQDIDMYWGRWTRYK